MTSQLLIVTLGGLSLTQLAVLAGLAVIGYRLVLILAFPWARCPKCDGAGRFFHGQNWRPCRRCGGTGRRLRLGRRVWRWVTDRQ